MEIKEKRIEEAKVAYILNLFHLRYNIFIVLLPNINL